MRTKNFILLQEAREAAEKINENNDLVELQEAVEMATLDKEMAEEKVCGEKSLLGPCQISMMRRVCENFTIKLDSVQNMSLGKVNACSKSTIKPLTL